MSDRHISESTLSIEEPPLPLRVKVAYGLANMASNSLVGIAEGGAISFFYNVKFGLDYNLVSLAWAIFAVWNAINDPIFGIIEDRTRTKIGRHIPYIRYGAPIYGLLFILAWFPFWVGDQWGLFFNLLLVLLSVDTLSTMIGLVIYSLPAEMTITAKGRTKLIQFSVIIGSGGMILANLLPILLLTGDKSPQLNPLFQPVMICLGIACTILLITSSYHLRENEFAQLEEPLGLLNSIKETFKNRPFLLYLVFSFSNTIFNTALSIGILYYIDYVVLLNGIMDYLQLFPVGIAIAIALLFGPRLVGRFGVKKVFLFGLIIGGAGFIATFFTGYTVFGALVTLCPAIFGFGLNQLTSPVIISDVMDFDELRTGKRRETTYAGINALITKPAVSLATALFLMIAGAFGFDASLPVQTTTAKEGILFGLFLIPGIFFLISAAVFTKFPLDGPKWAREKHVLIEIHKQKEIKYIEYLKQKGDLGGR